MSGVPTAVNDLERSVTAEITVRLFGPMEVRIGGAPMPRLRSRKGLWLLALLALRAGRDVEREWLAGTLWPECDNEHALRSLRQSVHNLRQIFGPLANTVVASPRTLCLDPAGTFVDALAFDAAVARGDADSLEHAVGLYRGPLLEDCAEEWCLSERRRREQAYVSALQSLASAAEARGDHAGAAERLRVAAGTEPFREDLQRARMEALARAGDAAAALVVYRELRSLLWKELSAEPDAETTALFRRIRDNARASVGAGLAPPASPASPSTGDTERRRTERRTPVPLTELIGREEAVREVRALLGRERLVTLAGPGGMGKTSLALQVARELEDDCAERASFAELAALADPAAVPDAVRSAVGLPLLDSREEPAAALGAALGSRSLLLVLDNCEHLLAACATLTHALLTRCPGLRILATSRHALGLPGETIWRVPPLALPPAAGPVSADSPDCPVYLGQFAAIRLFVERARAVESSFALTPQNAGAVLDICRRLDGIPLAVELAAARTRSLSAAEIGARLRRDFSLLAQPGPGVSGRHGTLASAFQWSWDLLSEPERAVLRRLSVFAGGCTLPAAELVCAGGGIAPEDVLDLLTALVDASLVIYTSTDDARYRLLETVRQLAAERLRAAGADEENDTRTRHRDFYLAWAEDIKPKQYGPDQARWFARAEADHENFRSAIEWCIEQRDVHAELRIVVALSRFWDTHGHLREGRERLEAALARATPELPAALRATAIVHAGWMACAQGENADARAHYERALPLLRQAGDTRAQIRVLNFLACAHVEAGDLARACALFEEARPLCIQHEYWNDLASVLNNLGEALIQRDDIAGARPCLEEAVRRCTQPGDRQLQGIALINLAIAELREERRDAARARGSEGLRVSHSCGALVDVPGGLQVMAALAVVDAEWVRAARLLGAASAVRESVGVQQNAFSARERERTESAVCGALGAERFAAELAAGRAMDVAQAVAFALGETDKEGGAG